MDRRRWRRGLVTAAPVDIADLLDIRALLEKGSAEQIAEKLEIAADDVPTLAFLIEHWNELI